MDSAEIIVELSNGHCKLNKDVLVNIISKAEDCQKISIMSMVGSNKSGKSILFNYIINYLDNKDVWLNNLAFDFNQEPINNSNIISIKMWSKPFILKDGNERIAIFLIDSSGVFEYNFGILSSQIMDDILGLFIYISSTLFYNTYFNINDKEIIHLYEVLDRFKFLPCVNEVVFQIWNCDSVIHSRYSYGFKGGNNYVSLKTQELKLENSVDHVKCCLLPYRCEPDTQSPNKPRIKEKYKIEILKMLNSDIFNINELKVKYICNDKIKANEFIGLFCKYIDALNMHYRSDLTTSLYSKLQSTKVFESMSSDEMLEELKKNKNFMTLYFNKDHIDFKLLEKHDNLLKEYKSTPYFDQYFESVVTTSIKLSNLKMEILKKFDRFLTINFSNDLMSEYKSRLSKNLDEVKEEVEKRAHDYLNDLVTQYRDKLNKALVLYKKEIQNRILEHFNQDSMPNNDFVALSKKCELDSIHLFNNLTTHTNISNIKQYNIFLHKLKDNLNNLKNDYLFVWKILTNYKLNWIEFLKEKIFFEESDLSEKYIKFENEIISHLNKVNEEIQLFARSTTKQYYAKIEAQNQQIFKDELKIIENVATYLKNRLLDNLSLKIKLKVFEKTDVTLILEKLLKIARNIIKDSKLLTKIQKIDCDKLLREKSESIITELRETYFETIVQTKNKFRRAREKALEKFCLDMTNFLEYDLFTAKQNYATKVLILEKNTILSFKNNIFNSEATIHEGYINEMLCEALKNLENNIKQQIMKFNEIYTKTISQQISIAIHFGSNISGGFYDNKIINIPDKRGEINRYNAVAFNRVLLFGNEAKIENDKILTSRGVNNKYFDIKELFFKDKSLIAHLDLSRYPYNFENNTTKVIANLNGIQEIFELETLISMIISNIMLDVKQITDKIIKRAVFTIPAYFDLRQRNLFKDIGKISELINVEILNEMTAAAVAYAYDEERYNYLNETISIFIVLNSYQIDIGIIHILAKTITYKSYETYNLLDLEPTFTPQEFQENFNRSCTIYNNDKSKNKLFKKFLNIFKEVIKLANIHKNEVKDVIICGDSLLRKSIREVCLKRYKHVYNCNFLDIILKGSIIYSKIPKDNDLKIYEVSKCQYDIMVRCNLAADYNDVIIKNEELPFKFKYTYQTVPTLKDLPFVIYIKQNNNVSCAFEIVNLPEFHKNDEWVSHKIIITITAFGEIEISSKIISNKGNYKEIEWFEKTLGFSETKINIEKNKLIKIFKNMNNTNSDVKQKLDQQKINLESYCVEIERSFEDKFKNISRLKRMQIEQSISEIRSFLESEDINIETLIEQKIKLNETVDFFK